MPFRKGKDCLQKETSSSTVCLSYSAFWWVFYGFLIFCHWIDLDEMKKNDTIGLKQLEFVKTVSVPHN